MGRYGSDTRKAPGSTLPERLKQQEDQARRRSAMAAAQSARLAARANVGQPAPADEQIHFRRDADVWVNALSKVPFKAVGQPTAPLSPIYEELLKIAIGTMNTGVPTVVLAWPARDVNLSAIASLLAVADTAVAPAVSLQRHGAKVDTFERPDGFRALLYPYARTAHELAREVQIDRNYLHHLHMAHYVRHTMGHDADPALKDYHQALSRVKTLTGVARDGESYPEFEHPTLDEILPHGDCSGVAHSNGTLLWRTSAKTDIKNFNTITGAANDGTKAAYFLHGLRAEEYPASALRKIQGALDLAIFDLTRTGRGRLGEDWASDAAKTFQAIRKSRPKTGVLVLTEDPWTFDKARFEVFNENESVRGKQRPPAESQTITAMSGSILDDGAKQPPLIGGEKVEAKGFNGPGAKVAEVLREIAHKARRSGDGEGAATVADIATKLRRNASLPGSLASLSNYVFTEHGQSAAADVMAGYRIGEQVRLLEQPTNPTFQIGGTELTAALRSAEEAMAVFKRFTPMSSLLEAIVTSMLGSSAKALFMFRKQTLAEFAMSDLVRKVPALQSRLEKDMIVFSGPGGLSDIAGLPTAERNKFKKIFVVAPPRDGVLSFFARSWLPSEIYVLADGDTLRFSSRDAFRLADQIREPEIASRLMKYATAAGNELEGLGTYKIQVTETPPLPEELQFPSESVINLAGAIIAGDADLVELTMDSGQRLIARPGTDLVRMDRSGALHSFRKVEARNVGIQDELCVISPSFIDRARLLVSIQANAAESIRDYHEAVVSRFQTLPGRTPSDRLHTLVDRIGDPDVEASRVRYWVHLDKQLQAPLHEVVTQAPRDHAMFLKFTQALGIGTVLANRFWQLGVKAQRNSRMKAGMAFHDAYRNILTDSFAAEAFAGTEKHSLQIKRLRILAEEHVATVTSIRKFKA